LTFIDALTRLESLKGTVERMLQSPNRHSRQTYILARKKTILQQIFQLLLKVLWKDHLPVMLLFRDQKPSKVPNLVMCKCKNQGERLILLKCKLQNNMAKIMLQDAAAQAI
jgi:hypothetical protein